MNSSNVKKKNAGVKRTDIHEPLLGSGDAQQNHLQSSGNSAPLDTGNSLISMSEMDGHNVFMKDTDDLNSKKGASALMNKTVVVSDFVEQINSSGQQPHDPSQTLSQGTEVHSVNQSFGNISLGMQSHMTQQEQPSANDLIALPKPSFIYAGG